MREAAKTLGKKLIMIGSCFLTAVFFYVSIVTAETLPHLEKEILPELYISADIDVPKELSGEMAKTKKNLYCGAGGKNTMDWKKDSEKRHRNRLSGSRYWKV